MDDYLMRQITFCVWFAGTMVVYWRGVTGKIDVKSFNDVPWSKCLKSPEHQLFLIVITSWFLMWAL
jgi:hypothetical protein